MAESVDLSSEVILNAMAAHIAILDTDGVIVKTNLAWQKFGRENQIGHAPESVGINYLAICDQAVGDSAEKAHLVAAGIRLVINGREAEFATTYPCHTPKELRWYYLRVVPLDQELPTRVILTHENITPLFKAKKNLELRSRELEERNTALKVLLEEHLKEKQEIERRILSNLHSHLQPDLEKVARALKTDRLRNQVVKIIDSLKEITSPLLSRLENIGIVLSPREVSVARLIRADKSSKEIASNLNISLETVQFHRKNLRRKLGLKKRSDSLKSHLMRLE